MTPAAKLVAYGLVLAVALGGGAAVGAAAGPIDDTSGASSHDEGTEGHVDEHGSATPGPARVEDTMPAGLLTAQDGYLLEADDTIVESPATDDFRFRITREDGSVVHDFADDHDRELHFIVVGSDLATYAHLHPDRAADGTWSVPLGDLAPGVYRAYANFAVADGPELTLGVDLAVPGPAAYAPLAEPDARGVVDGYDVTLTGSPVAGRSAEVTLNVELHGRPVADLEPYLGAFGHLVAIRSGDLAYLHVHPLGGEPDDVAARGGPAVRFAVEVPSPGDYRLFFDFAHEGEVRTAAFTVHVPAAPDEEAA